MENKNPQNFDSSEKAKLYGEYFEQGEPMWEKFCSDYEVDAKILSRGKLSQENFELFQDYRYKDRDLVLIDESHHFRNNNSRQYENLKAFMEKNDAKGILLESIQGTNQSSKKSNKGISRKNT